MPVQPSSVSRSAGVPLVKRLPAVPARFSAPVTYQDGLAVAVTKTTHDIVTATGAGAMTGSPTSTFAVTFTNGTKAPIDLAAVVVEAHYGPGRQLAAPVYADNVQDFTGLLAAHGSSTAAYTFSIPPTALKDVTLSVDFDGVHVPAVFTGVVG